jgi:Amt family ammonium transporter
MGVDTSTVVTGLFAGGGVTQLIGSASITVISFGVALVLMYVVKATGTLRVSAAGEIEGLDIHEHGASAYPEYAFKGNDGTPRSLEEVKSKVKGTGLAPSASAGD